MMGNPPPNPETHTELRWKSALTENVLPNWVVVIDRLHHAVAVAINANTRVTMGTTTLATTFALNRRPSSLVGGWYRIPCGGEAVGGPYVGTDGGRPAVIDSLLRNGTLRRTYKASAVRSPTAASVPGPRRGVPGAGPATHPGRRGSVGARPRQRPLTSERLCTALPSSACQNLLSCSHEAGRISGLIQ